jgi:hypothetical protein
VPVLLRGNLGIFVRKAAALKLLLFPGKKSFKMLKYEGYSEKRKSFSGKNLACWRNWKYNVFILSKKGSDK